MPGEAELQEKIREQSRIFFTYQKQPSAISYQPGKTPLILNAES